MNKFYFFLLLILWFPLSVFAQKPAVPDTAYDPKNNDTIAIGKFLIIKKNKKGKNDSANTVQVPVAIQKANGITTDYAIIDIGFANFSDKTNYSATRNYLINKPGSPPFSETDIKLRGGKSINVNIWFFKQNIPLIKTNVQLQYGLGIELNNYRFRSAISFKEKGSIPYTSGVQSGSSFIFRDSVSFSKNKLAADYLTVPVMLNFIRGKAKRPVNIGFGVSDGYLYSQRNKQTSKERGTEKNKGNYGLRRFKFAYIAELGIGKIKLYGSFSSKSLFENALDLRPYNAGLRFSFL